MQEVEGRSYLGKAKFKLQVSIFHPSPGLCFSFVKWWDQVTWSLKFLLTQAFSDFFFSGAWWLAIRNSFALTDGLIHALWFWSPELSSQSRWSNDTAHWRHCLAFKKKPLIIQTNCVCCWISQEPRLCAYRSLEPMGTHVHREPVSWACFHEDTESSGGTSPQGAPCSSARCPAAWPSQSFPSVSSLNHPVLTYILIPFLPSQSLWDTIPSFLYIFVPGNLAYSPLSLTLQGRQLVKANTVVSREEFGWAWISLL